MNHKVSRRYLPVVMMASSLAVASACSSTGGTGSMTPTGGPTSAGASSAPPAVAATAVPGALTISNGTADVTVGKATVHLPSAATDASWSADGSQLAYIDADGNVAIANWDGTGVRVLTKTNKSVLRAQPAWIANNYEIAYSLRDKKGVWHLDSVSAVTPRLGDPGTPYEGDATPNQSGHDHAPSSAYIAGTRGDDGVDLMAYEHDAASGAQVFIVDYNQREPDGEFLVAGSHPALSPDGKSVAYIGKNGQLYVTPIAKASKSTSKQITFGLTGIAHPVWSPDGDRIAFATATDVESVAAKLAPGVATNPPTVEAPKPGVPAYVPRATTTVTRLTGADPIADSIALSTLDWNVHNDKVNTPSQADLTLPSTVTLVSSADPTVLAQMAALGGAGGPVLFTDGKTLDPSTAAEIKRALAKASDPSQELGIRIYGSATVMSPAIETAAKALGYPVTRTDGSVTPLQNFPVVVVSDTDQAALGNLLYLYQNFEVVRLHGTTMTPAQQNLFREPDSSTGPLMVYTAGPAAHAAAAASWSGKPPANHIRIVDLPTAPSDESVKFQPYSLDEVTLVAEGDWKSMVLANLTNATVIVVGQGGSLSPAAIAWLRANAAAIGTVNAFGDTAHVSDATLAAAAAAVSGPAGSSS